MIAFKNQGHRVISLSQQEGLKIHEILKKYDIEVHSHALKGKRIGWLYYIIQLIRFIIFCWIHKVDIVYSHLEPASFVASLGQYFIRAKTYLCRHHIEEAKFSGFDRSVSYRITYWLARDIIVVSNQARDYMIKNESIPENKIRHIDLAYDFSLYDQIDNKQVEIIKKNYTCDILLVAAGRFTEFKRLDIAIRTVHELQQKGIYAKLVLLGQGETNERLSALATQLKIEDQVFMPGYVSNVLDYFSAADFLLHPSLLESSCVVVKEAGLVSLPAIMCEGVGDFADYIEHGYNGFLVNQNSFEDSAANIIFDTMQKKQQLRIIGDNLRVKILEKFKINVILPLYDQINAN
jgi:glycosyltransferase involved in cell wall biosynthesis